MRGSDLVQAERASQLAVLDFVRFLLFIKPARQEYGKQWMRMYRDPRGSSGRLHQGRIEIR